MTPTIVPQAENTNAFRCHRLVFDHSDLVSMHVTCSLHQSLQQTVLLFTFSQFNDLLRFSGKTGEALQISVSDKLWHAEDAPYVIDFHDAGPVFTSCTLIVSELISGDTSCYSVDVLTPLSFVQRARNLRTNIAYFGKASLDQNEMVNEALQKAAAMYRYYHGLIALNISEASAREKAGLKNECLFKMACDAAKHIHRPKALVNKPL